MLSSQQLELGYYVVELGLVHSEWAIVSFEIEGR